MTSLLLWKSLLIDNGAAKSRNFTGEPKKKLCEDLNLCRICNVGSGEIPIIDNLVHPNITEEIYNLSGVKMEYTDGQSKHICESCFNLLNGCIMFREMCRKSNNMIFEINIMRETYKKPSYANCTKCNDIDQQTEWDSSYNMPSPNYSEKCTKSSWTFDKYTNLVFSNTSRRLQRKGKKKEAKDDSTSLPITCLCDVCGKILHSKSIMSHMTTHTKVFPYRCNKCPYRGRTMDLLKTHKRTHLSKAELPYRCTKCPTAMAAAGNLAKHMRTMHGRTSSLTNKPYKCALCETAFTYKADMKRHIIQKHQQYEHAKESTIECEICLNQFSTKHILLEHQINVHKLKRKIKGLGRIPAYLKAQLE